MHRNCVQQSKPGRTPFLWTRHALQITVQRHAFSRGGNHGDLEEPMAASLYWYPWSQCSLSRCQCPRSNLYRLGHPRPHLESQRQSSLTDRTSARSLVAKTLNRIQLRCLSGGIVSKKNSDTGGKQTANGEHLWCQLGWKREELFDDG